MPTEDPVAYEPVSVKAVLVEMKDTAELLLDLSYSAVLLDDEELATEVLDLEERMDALRLRAWMSLLLAARNPDDAESLAPVVGLVGAAEKISDAAGDIAAVVLEEAEILSAIRSALPEAIESVVRATLTAEAPYADLTLGEINLETETGVRVLAIRRHGDWLLSPDRDTRLQAGDVLLCRGPESGIETAYPNMTGSAYQPPEPAQPEIDDLERAVDSIVLMKNMSELSVDLAYGAVLFDSEHLANEVFELEAEVDALQRRLEVWVLRAVEDGADPLSLRGLLHIAGASEVISDAALEISEGVLRGISGHPVVAEAIQESDEVIQRFVVAAGCPLEERRIGEAAVATETGMYIIAIRRGDEEDTDWIVSPGPETALRPGDVLIAKGTRAGAERLDELTAG